MRRLLVIDAKVTPASPSMRGWLAAAAAFQDQFDEIEVWACHCSLAGPKVHFRPIKTRLFPGALAAVGFSWAVNRRLRRRTASWFRETLIQCTGCTSTRADIRFIHFWNTAFMAAAKSAGADLKLGFREKLFRRIAVHDETAALRAGHTGAWWCVSRGIAEPIHPADQNRAPVGYLPNAYDDTRFNHQTRGQWRGPMRGHYGFQPDETVFGFSGFGHFERKGLRQAVAAVNLLAEKGLKVRLLVIGGKPAVVAAFQKGLETAGVSTANLVFTGLVTEMEKHLAAADALFFPSHFEAFSLAEIEAAALGLRLYLTAHPGREMILREPVNGRLLPWGAPGMAAVLEEEIRSGTVRQPHHEMGEALNPSAYQKALSQLFAAAIVRKWPPPPTPA